MTRALLLAAAAAGLLCVGCAATSTKPGSAPGAKAIVPARGSPVTRRPVTEVRGPLTVARSVEIALENNLRLQSAGLERTKALAAVKEAKRSFLPTLSARATYMRLDEVPKFTIPPPMGPIEMEMGKLDNYAVSLSLSQPVWLGGKMRLGLRAARVASGLAELGRSIAEQGIVFGVKMAYYDILLGEEDLKAGEEAEELARRHLGDTERRFESGAATKFEVTRAEVRLNGAAAALIRSRNAVKLARASFLNLLRLPPETELQLADGLAHRPAAVSAEEAFEEAVKQRPDLAMAVESLELQRLKVEATWREYLPNVMLTGDAGVENPSQRKLGAEGWASYWSAGAMVTFPVFEGGRIAARLEAERASLKQRQLAVEELRDSIRLEITRATLTLTDAEEFVGSQEKAVGQAKEGLRLAKVGYENGVLTQLDVLDAQMGLTQARKLHAQALYGHAMARLALGRAVGKP